MGTQGIRLLCALALLIANSSAAEINAHIISVAAKGGWSLIGRPFFCCRPFP